VEFERGLRRPFALLAACASKFGTHLVFNKETHLMPMSELIASYEERALDFFEELSSLPDNYKDERDAIRVEDILPLPTVKETLASLRVVQSLLEQQDLFAMLWARLVPENPIDLAIRRHLQHIFLLPSLKLTVMDVKLSTEGKSPKIKLTKMLSVFCRLQTLSDGHPRPDLAFETKPLRNFSDLHWRDASFGVVESDFVPLAPAAIQSLKQSYSVEIVLCGGKQSKVFSKPKETKLGKVVLSFEELERSAAEGLCWFDCIPVGPAKKPASTEGMKICLDVEVVYPINFSQ